MSTPAIDRGEPAPRRPAYFRVTDLEVSRKQPGPSLTFVTAPGLTLLHHDRENFATSLSLALAGRLNISAGSIVLDTGEGEFETARQRFRRVALAGAREVDSLERAVPTEEIVREQISWQAPALSRAPRRALADRRYTRWAQLLGLDIEPSTTPGGLRVIDRFLLRIALALVARPDADILVVDDVDQIKDAGAQATVLAALASLAQHVPVVAATVNTGGDQLAASVVTLTSEAGA